MADNNPAPKPDGNKPPVDEAQGKDKGGNSKNFTQEQLDSIVKDRLEKAEKSAEERTNKAIADAIAEQERKAKLSSEEKAAEESKKKSEELAGKERDLALRENRADARELLLEKSISADLVDYVVDVDAGKTKDNIEKLEKVWNKAIEEAVEAKLKGNTPKDFTGDKNKKTQNDKPTGNRVF